MASLEMAPRQMFDCVQKEKNLKVFIRDHFNIYLVFPVDDSENNEGGKSKEILEISSRSSVSETGESLQNPSSNPNQTSSPRETNSNVFYNPGQPENTSRNDIIMGASSLVQIWEARSQQSSSSQSDRSYISDSCEKETEAGSFLPLVTCTQRIIGRQVFADFFEMIVRDQKKELEWLADRYAVSKFSPRGCGRLQYMLRIRKLERCIAIQERHHSKSTTSDVNRSLQGSSLMSLRDRYKENTEKGSVGNVNSAVETTSSSRSVSSGVKKVCKMANKTGHENVLQETMEKSNPRETQDATYESKIIKKLVLSEAAGNKNGLKKPEIGRKATKEEERSRETMEKSIVKESLETNKTSLSIAEKVNLWDSKEKTNKRKPTEKAENEGKTARRVVDVNTVERTKDRRKKEEVSSFEEGQSMEIDDYGINFQEVTSVISLYKRKEEETASHQSSESGKEEKASQDDEETSKAEKQEQSEKLWMSLGSQIFQNGWDENEPEDEEYSGESVYYDWVSEISRPQSYWDNLRKQRELEVMNNDSKKDDIRNLIQRKTVSRFLASDFREKIDKILISSAKRRLQVERNLVEEGEGEEEEEENSEESLVECSARYQEKLEENETEKVDLETISVSDGFSQSSPRSTMMTWSFEDHEVAATVSLNPKDHENTSSEMKMISDLIEQMKQLQREMLELKSLVKSCVDFQKSVKLESFSVSDSLQRNCSVCFEMPIDSLLYRCGHMCTCLKCGHELQWSSMKCPICMAPIVDVVRAFLDS